jgi:dTMP kinase
MNGRLVAFEGIDGSGKSTVARHINQYLLSKGILTRHIDIATLPADSIMAQIKKISKDPKNAHMSPIAETFLYLSSLSQRVAEYVVPYITGREIILADRYEMSVLVLAHYGRGQSRKQVLEWLQFATQGISPDLTVLCDLDVSVAAKRKELQSRTPSRKESEGPKLYELLRSGYLKEAADLNEKCLILRSDHLSIANMFSQAEERIDKLLNLVTL